jgi:hypothetical protein
MYEIRKNQPLPAAKKGKRNFSGEVKTTLGELKVDESFLVPLKNWSKKIGDLTKLQNWTATAVTNYCKNYKSKKFTTRMMKEENAIGVWRIK